MSMNEILREFLLETQENLAILDTDLVKLEKNPAEKSTLAQVFRTLHSIKGTAGFIGLVKLQSLAHSAESLLSRLRAGELRFNPAIATALLQVVDAVREMLSNIESSGGEGAGDYSAIASELNRLRENGGESPSIAAGRTSGSPASVKLDLREQFAEPVVDPNLTISMADGRPAMPASPIQKPLFDATLPPPDPPTPAPAAAKPAVESAVAVIPAPPTALPPPAAVPITSAATVPPAPSPVASLSPAIAPREASVIEPAEPRPVNVSDTSIRVDVGLLDKLMTLVGELVLARNQILQYSETHEDRSFLGAVQRLNLLTTDLQASVMKTRMQAIGNLWSKFPRVVRDLAVACGKQVRFEMEGQETELDKTLIEAIRDPLTHMVRNAVDHGIESPEIRASRGKPSEGRLRMLAFHEGGKVVIEISDDGAGVDVTRVRDKAIDAKLITPETAARMSRHELLRLIFLPGFSTADRVTQFSGRGVGMDVVRTNIEKIGGTVDIESSLGKGTTIRTKIPLTLAIIPALIVVSGGQRYAIPQVSLLELVWLDPDRAALGIEWMQGTPVYRLRGNLLPVVFLSEQLELEATHNPEQGLSIVVLQADDRQFGLVVDAIRDTEEIVVKPLQKQLKGIAVFSGAAIMGDGRVALILDVLGIAQKANVITATKGRGLGEKEPAEAQPDLEIESLLLFSSDVGGQMAIPLARVARLEVIPRAALESIGSGQVVQYRGEILSLIDVAGELDRMSRVEGAAAYKESPRRGASEDFEGDSPESVSVVVYAGGQQRVGLVVGRILDIVHEPVTARCRATRLGVLFTAVVQGKVTEFVDVAALVRESPTAVPVPMA